jgi:hypothetical protein
MGASVAKLVRKAPFIGPAVVDEVDGRAVVVSLAFGRAVRAELAIPYEPVPGDTLLVIGEEEHWVIGVLSGRGKHVLAQTGDVVVHAVGGALDLRGDAGVRISAPAVEVRAGALRTIAETVVEAFGTLHQRVADLLHVQARQACTMVEKESILQARSASIHTEETVNVNGREIHLG